MKWNRQTPHILASSHDKFLRIWDSRKGAHPLRSIAAHTTKIYGVDWSRTDTTNLVTCSLDRTIKLWDFEAEFDEPDHVFDTSFPVWRARYTPFGYGLLAMPQRGDHDLHLYDRRLDAAQGELHVTPPAHTFVGHEDQVKEFLWRPRGTVTETNDDREFQLVSWGTDRKLRLHHVDEHVLYSVGYQKGMDVTRRMNFTRRDAVYKTFRENTLPLKNGNEFRSAQERDSHNKGSNDFSHFRLASSISKAPVRFAGGYGNIEPMGSHLGRNRNTSKEMDPIAWMRGVKIGKREDSPTALPFNVPSIVSPSLNVDTWDEFENLGDEITHAGDKFKKVTFEEV